MTKNPIVFDEFPFNDFYGKVIKSCAFVYRGHMDTEVGLVISFEDDTFLEIFDSGQLCCELRFMSCSDVLGDLVGHTFNSINMKTLGSDGSDPFYDVAFLEIKAGDEIVTITNHNQHNGYYGGFNLVVNIG